MRKFYIDPVDNRKSFYNKCSVTEYDSGEKVLTSYTTPVMKITKEGEPVRLWGGYSATTQRLYIVGPLRLSQKESII